jgi:hypothetical protein
MEEEEEMDEMDLNLNEDFVDENEIDLEELLAEIENEETSLNEGEEGEEEEEEEESEESEEEESEEESLSVADMTDEDLKKYIEEVIGEMYENGELDGKPEDENADGYEDEEIEGLEGVDGEMEEIDLAELLAEIDNYDEDPDDEDVDFDNDKKALKTFGVNFDLEDTDFKFEDEESMEEGLGSALKNFFSSPAGRFYNKNKDEIVRAQGLEGEAKQKALEDIVKRFKSEEEKSISDSSIINNYVNLFREKLKLKDISGPTRESQSVQVKELNETINSLRSELNEINVLNAKLLYTNKIFKAKNLTENQKLQVLKSFDKVSTVKESKLVYETISEGLTAKKPLIRENLGSASRSIITPARKPIIDENDQFARMQKLAFGENKY